MHHRKSTVGLSKLQKIPRAISKLLICVRISTTPLQYFCVVCAFTTLNTIELFRCRNQILTQECPLAAGILAYDILYIHFHDNIYVYQQPSAYYKHVYEVKHFKLPCKMTKRIKYFRFIITHTLVN